MNMQSFLSMLRILVGIGGGVLTQRGLATHADVESAATDLYTIIPALFSLGSFVWSVYSHWNMKKVPEKSIAVLPSVPSDAPEKGLTAQVVGKVVGAILLALSLSLFAQVDRASAQAPKLTGNIVRDFAPVAKPANTLDGALASFNDGVQKIEKTLVDKGIADLNAAITDATNHSDNISLPCWQSNLKLLQSLPSQWDTPPSPIGVALGIQIQRDLLNSITGNEATSLKVACAALWGDQIKIVTNVGALIGIRIATGGLF